MVIIGHEFGHFLIAKWSGIYVYEFAFGFGPALFQFKKNETVYSLRVFPLGGFVRLAGEEESDLNVPKERNLETKSPLIKIVLALAGPVSNFILSIILLTLIFAFVGTSELTNEIAEIAPGFPAEAAGLKVGDKIESINNISAKDMALVIQTINQSADKPLKLIIKRGERIQRYLITPKLDAKRSIGRLGFTPKVIHKRQNPISAFILSCSGVGFMIVMTFVVLGQIFSGNLAVFNSVMGPIGIAGAVGKAASDGAASLASMTAIISTGLGSFNLIPLPPLDGGLILFGLIEAVIRRPLSYRFKRAILIIGWVLMLALMAHVTRVDIMRFFVPQ